MYFDHTVHRIIYAPSIYMYSAIVYYAMDTPGVCQIHCEPMKKNQIRGELDQS